MALLSGTADQAEQLSKALNNLNELADRSKLEAMKLRDVKALYHALGGSEKLGQKGEPWRDACHSKIIEATATGSQLSFDASVVQGLSPLSAADLLNQYDASVDNLDSGVIPLCSSLLGAVASFTVPDDHVAAVKHVKDELRPYFEHIFHPSPDALDSFDDDLFGCENVLSLMDGTVASCLPVMPSNKRTIQTVSMKLLVITKKWMLTPSGASARADMNMTAVGEKRPAPTRPAEAASSDDDGAAGLRAMMKSMKAIKPTSVDAILDECEREGMMKFEEGGLAQALQNPDTDPAVERAVFKIGQGISDMKALPGGTKCFISDLRQHQILRLPYIAPSDRTLMKMSNYDFRAPKFPWPAFSEREVARAANLSAPKIRRTQDNALVAFDQDEDESLGACGSSHMLQKCISNVFIMMQCFAPQPVLSDFASMMGQMSSFSGLLSFEGQSSYLAHWANSFSSAYSAFILGRQSERPMWMDIHAQAHMRNYLNNMQVTFPANNTPMVQQLMGRLAELEKKQGSDRGGKPKGGKAPKDKQKIPEGKMKPFEFISKCRGWKRKPCYNLYLGKCDDGPSCKYCHDVAPGADPFANVAAASAAPEWSASAPCAPSFPPIILNYDLHADARLLASHERSHDSGVTTFISKPDCQPVPTGPAGDDFEVMGTLEGSLAVDNESCADPCVSCQEPVPAALLSEAWDYHPGYLAEMEPFLKECKVLPDDWVLPSLRRFPMTNPAAVTPMAYPPVCQMGDHPDFQPDSYLDVISEAGLLFHDEWMAAASLDEQHILKSVASGGPPHRPRCKEGILDATYTRPLAQGAVWDLRDPFKPVRVSPSRANNKLNLVFFNEWMARLDWPDLRLPMELEYGWSGYSNELPQISIYSPHHKSVSKVMLSTGLEIEVEVGKGWQSVHDLPPFWPLRVVPNGSHEKPRSDKMRRCVDLSWPLTLLWDVRLSVNRNVELTEAEKVPFPTQRHISQAVTVLSTAPRPLPVVLLRFDESTAYKQTTMCTTEMWKQVMFWDGKLLADDRLLYGGSFGPNCYMRFGSLKHKILCRMIASRVLFSDPDVLAWMEFRRRLFPDEPEQWLPVWLCIYIDDHIVACLTFDVAFQIIEVYKEFERVSGVAFNWDKFLMEGTPAVTKDLLGVEYAMEVPGKRYPPDKIKWMLLHLSEWLMKSEARPNELLSLMMRLLWAASVVLYLRLKLNVGFALLRHGDRRRGKVILTEEFKISLSWARDALSTTHTVPLIWNDAWMQGATMAWAGDASGWGYGGAVKMAGTWYMFYGSWTAEELVWLDINALELACQLFCSAVFNWAFHTCRILIECDNESSTKVVNNGKAHGPMAVTLDRCQLLWSARNQHVFAKFLRGIFNTLPDALSRALAFPAYWDIVSEMTAGCPVVYLEVPLWARDLSREVAASKALSIFKDRVYTPGVRRIPLTRALGRVGGGR